ncbi:MAG: hypothetical protein EXR53_00280 [Dehalococcoidia bacterium]|nr:hypothetical protein [Dehalococcoidia bacterium]
MRAARLAGPKRFELVQTELPHLQDGHVLINLQRVSICGSDLRMYDRVLPEEQYPLPVGRPCHECAGVVVESRDDAYRPGQRVIVLPTTHNGLMEYIAEPAYRLIPLPDHGDLSTLLMCQPVGTVMYSCQRIGSVLGKRVVILGQGAIGLAFTQWMAQQGARQVIVTDLLDYRLEAARRAGATHTINPTKEQVAATVAEITHGEMADVVVEAVGRPETANIIWDLVRKQGLVALFGLPHDEETFPFRYNAMMDKLPTIVVTVGARTPDPTQHIEECVDLVAQGRLDLSHMITHRLPFDQVQRAYDMYSEKLDNIIKVVLEL